MARKRVEQVIPQLDIADRDYYGCEWRTDARGYLVLAGAQEPTYLHRLVAARILYPGMDTPPSLPHTVRVGHYDDNKKNNHRENIRIRSFSDQIRANKRGTTSRFRGVYKLSSTDKWHVKVYYYIGEKLVAQNLGDFDDEVEAAHVYDRRAVEVIPHPVLNFPEEQAGQK